MVCSCMKVQAGVSYIDKISAHRVEVTTLLDNRFDGDALNCSISLDNFMSDKWYPLDPRFNIFQLTTPYEVSGNIAMPKPNIASISSWLAG